MTTCRPIDIFRRLFVDVPETQKGHQPRTVALTNSRRAGHKLQKNIGGHKLEVYLVIFRGWAGQWNTDCFYHSKFSIQDNMIKNRTLVWYLTMNVWTYLQLYMVVWSIQASTLFKKKIYPAVKIHPGKFEDEPGNFLAIRSINVRNVAKNSKKKQRIYR